MSFLDEDETESVRDEVVRQLLEYGSAQINLPSGFTLEVYYPNPNHLTWPWDAFYRLTQEYVGGDALWEVLQMYSVFVFDGNSK